MISIEEQEIQLDKLIKFVVENPTEENKEEYLHLLNILEYSILEESQKYKENTPEHFNIRKEAFAIRPKYAKLMLNLWVSNYKTTSGCPHEYQDTLSIPFRQIKKPKDLD